MRRFYFGAIIRLVKGPLGAQFPELVICAISKKATVSSYVERHGSRGNSIWGPIFRRNLKEDEGNKVISLLDLLSSVIVPKHLVGTRRENLDSF